MKPVEVKIVEQNQKIAVQNARIRKIDERLKKLEEFYYSFQKVQRRKLLLPKDSNLLRLPAHLQHTTMILRELGKATATQLSERTGKSRAVESSYLNELMLLGFATKKRIHRVVTYKPS